MPDRRGAENGGAAGEGPITITATPEDEIHLWRATINYD